MSSEGILLLRGIVLLTEISRQDSLLIVGPHIQDVNLL